ARRGGRELRQGALSHAANTPLAVALDWVHGRVSPSLFPLLVRPRTRLLTAARPLRETPLAPHPQPAVDYHCPSPRREHLDRIEVELAELRYDLDQRRHPEDDGD